MQYIVNNLEERTICDNSHIKKRQNSLKINYFNKVNDKPWGKEYLAYQNEHIGIWILSVDKEQETSLHCHFKKDTILIPISGCFKINLYNGFKIIHVFESLYIPLNTFHGIFSYTNNALLMEIEIYTDVITYTDKNDLLRIKDVYNRDKNNYEISVVERIPGENEIMNFHDTNEYIINNTKISILEIDKNNDYSKLMNEYNKIILLEGILFSNGTRMTSGSFIDLNHHHSFLTIKIKVLCLSNIDCHLLNKIIYSKKHLIDFLQIYEDMNSNSIGLTSGCFDILHEGHIKNLKICKSKIPKLFVCLSSDEQIKRLKGDSRPINNKNDRLYILLHLNFIDYIILYEEFDDDLEIELDNIINIINPKIWFKGTDYTKEAILKKHPSLKNIELIDLIQGKSTTNIINKIKY